MKCRWLAIAIALAAFSAGPWTHAQVQDQDKDQPKASDSDQAKLPPPAALPLTADDSQVKHDGTKTDVDAVGNRNVGCGRGVGKLVHGGRPGSAGRAVYAQQIEAQNQAGKRSRGYRVCEPHRPVNLVRNSDAQVPLHHQSD